MYRGARTVLSVVKGVAIKHSSETERYFSLLNGFQKLEERNYVKSLHCSCSPITAPQTYWINRTGTKSDTALMTLNELGAPQSYTVLELI